MKTQKAQDILFGIVILAIAAFYTIMTFQIQYKPGVVDGRTIPIILSVLLWVLGLTQLWFARKAGTAPLEKQGIDRDTVVKTAVLIVLYIGLFELVGFLIMTFLYLLAQFAVLTPADRKPNLIGYAILGAAISLFVYTTFRYGLDIMLPQGIITFF